MKYAVFVVFITMQLIVFRDSGACLHQVSKTTGMPISAQKSWKRPSRMKKAATYIEFSLSDIALVEFMSWNLSLFLKKSSLDSWHLNLLLSVVLKHIHIILFRLFRKIKEDIEEKWKFKIFVFILQDET